MKDSSFLPGQFPGRYLVASHQQANALAVDGIGAPALKGHPGSPSQCALQDILKFPASVVDLCFALFSSISYCLVSFEALLLGTYIYDGYIFSVKFSFQKQISCLFSPCDLLKFHFIRYVDYYLHPSVFSQRSRTSMNTERFFFFLQGIGLFNCGGLLGKFKTHRGQSGRKDRLKALSTVSRFLLHQGSLNSAFKALQLIESGPPKLCRVNSFT